MAPILNCRTPMLRLALPLLTALVVGLTGCRTGERPSGVSLGEARQGAVVAQLWSPEPGRYAVRIQGEDLRDVKATLKAPLAGFPDVPLRARGDVLEGQGARLPEFVPSFTVTLEKTGVPARVLRFAGRGNAPLSVAPGDGGTDQELIALVTDSTCLLRGGVETTPDRECAIRCIHAGAAVMLVAREGEGVYTAVGANGASAKELLLPYVGYDVRVRGRVFEEDGEPHFEIHEVFPAHSHTPEFGGAVGMAGDLHLELLALRSGEVRVYLSDRFRRPVSAEGQRGSVELRDPQGATRQVELAVVSGGRALVGNVGALGAAPVEFVTRLKLTPEVVEKFGVSKERAKGGLPMSFMVEPQDGAAPPTREPEHAP